MEKTYLILHGWGGSGPEHWQTWIADRLRAEGKEVLYPRLPNAGTPELEEWISALHERIKEVKNPLVVLAHSVAGALWIQYLSRHPEVNCEKVFLVAPTRVFRIPELKSFFPLPKVDLGEAREKYLIVASDNDPYIPKEEFEDLAEDLNVPVHWMPGAGHLNVAAGYGPFPWLYEQALLE